MKNFAASNNKNIFSRFNPTDESSDDETQLSICTGSTCHSNHGPMIDLKVSTQPTSCLLIRGLNKATSQRLLHNYIEYLGVRMTILMKDAEVSCINNSIWLIIKSILPKINFFNYSSYLFQKRSLGFAFAFFDDDKSAMMAKRKLKHFKIDDNEIKVFFSKREKPLNAPTERYLSRFPRWVSRKLLNIIRHTKHLYHYELYFTFFTGTWFQKTQIQYCRDTGKPLFLFNNLLIYSYNLFWSFHVNLV